MPGARGHRHPFALHRGPLQAAQTDQLEPAVGLDLLHHRAQSIHMRCQPARRILLFPRRRNQQRTLGGDGLLHRQRRKGRLHEFDSPACVPGRAGNVQQINQEVNRLVQINRG